jgi:hypothetical protein
MSKIYGSISQIHSTGAVLRFTPVPTSPDRPLTSGRTAIICGSASTFRILFKTYLPGLWGSRAVNSGIKGHPYNPSSTGDFALKPYGAGSQQQSRNMDLSVNDVNGVDSRSERLDSERSTLAGNSKHGIRMSTEFAMKISEPSVDEAGDHIAPYKGV